MYSYIYAPFFTKISAWVFLIHMFLYAGFYCKLHIITTHYFLSFHIHLKYSIRDQRQRHVFNFCFGLANSACAISKLACCSLAQTSCQLFWHGLKTCLAKSQNSLEFSVCWCQKDSLSTAYKFTAVKHKYVSKFTRTCLLYGKWNGKM